MYKTVSISKIISLSILFLFVISFCYSASLSAASQNTLSDKTTKVIEGYVFLQGQIDHSKTAVSIISGSLPTINIFGFIVILFIFSFILYKMRRRVSILIPLIF